VPIAARDKVAIEKYVGRIVSQLTATAADKALLVDAYAPEMPDPRLAIWDVPEAVVLHFSRQVWVHVDYRAFGEHIGTPFQISNWPVWYSTT